MTSLALRAVLALYVFDTAHAVAGTHPKTRMHMLTDDGLRVDPFHDEFRLAALGEPPEGVAAEPLVNLTVGLAPGDILGPSPLGSDDAGAPLPGVAGNVSGTAAGPEQSASVLSLLQDRPRGADRMNANGSVVPHAANQPTASPRTARPANATRARVPPGRAVTAPAGAVEARGAPRPESDAALLRDWATVVLLASVPALLLNEVLWSVLPGPLGLRGPTRVESVRWPWLTLLDGIRFFAAVHIAVYHFFGKTWPGVVDLGRYWFDFFFFTSGFVSVYAQQGRDRPAMAQQLWAKLTRIYPFYAVAFILAFVVTQEDSVLTIVSTMTLTQTWLPPAVHLFKEESASIDDSDRIRDAWYLSNLAVFWYLTPRFRYLLDRLSKRNVGLLLVSCWTATLWPAVVNAVINSIAARSTMHFIESSPILRFPMYLGGMAFAQLVVSEHGGPAKSNALAVLAQTEAIAVQFILLIGTYFGLLELHADHHSLHGGCGFVTFPAICSLHSVAIIAEVRGLQWTPQARTALRVAGAASWPIYLLHQPVLKIAMAFVLRSDVLGLGLAHAAQQAMQPSILAAVIIFALLYASRNLEDRVRQTDDGGLIVHQKEGITDVGS